MFNRQNRRTVWDEFQYQIGKLNSQLAKLTVRNATVWLSEISDLLQSMPLSTDEYGIARSRIKNSLRYLASNEVGAARYELRILERSLAQESTVPTWVRVAHRRNRRQQILPSEELQSHTI